MKSNSPSSIYVTFQFEGIHQYEDAPKEVHFLKYPHRHIFKGCLEIEVRHDDRELEFIVVKRYVERVVVKSLGINLEKMSCEAIARYIGTLVSQRWPFRTIKVDISEDGENGARIIL